MSHITEPPQAPLSFDIKPSQLIDEARTLNTELDTVIESIILSAQISSPSFKTSIEPFIQCENVRLIRARHIKFHASTSCHKDLRDASNAATKLIEERDIELLHDERFFAIVDSVWRDAFHPPPRSPSGEAHADDGLDAAARHYLSKLHGNFEQSGSGIADAGQRLRLKAIRKRIADLQRLALKNLNGDTSGLWLSRSELDGLPEDVFRRLRTTDTTTATDIGAITTNANITASQGNDGSNLVSKPETSDGHTERSGQQSQTKYWITMKDPDVNAVRRHVLSERTRRAVTAAAANRCPQNIDVYTEVFALRHQAARLLGFDNHGAFRMRYKMLGDVAVVCNFLHRVSGQLKSSRDRALEHMRTVKRQDVHARRAAMSAAGRVDGDGDSDFDGKGGDTGAEVESLIADDRVLWGDIAYYDRIIKEEMLSCDQLEVAEYFALDRTLSGLLGIFEHLFGIKVEEIAEPQDAWIWHSSVRMYTVWDRDKSHDFLGYLYLDFFPRDGKYTHAGHYGLSPGFLDSEDKRHYPSSAVVMNLPPPTRSKPSLLKHEELRRVFHEIGHAMHNLLSKVRYARFHGTNVDTDFIEAPSMMFEHFLWTHEYMRSVSYHYSHISPEYMETWKQEQLQKGEDHQLQPKPVHIPDALVDKLVEGKQVNRAVNEMTKAWMAMFDIEIHSPASDAVAESRNAEDYGKLWYGLRTEFLGFEDLNSQGEKKVGHGWSAFRAIMGKYDVGYYTYVLAQIYSCDLFYTGFKGDSMNPERGRRYRYFVLEPGGSQPEMETLRTFLGRDPNTEAFCLEHGIQNA